MTITLVLPSIQFVVIRSVLAIMNQEVVGTKRFRVITNRMAKGVFMSKVNGPIVSTESEVMKHCVVCGEDIRTDAVKCVHCGSYQNRRGRFDSNTGITSVILALLTALVSVAGVAIPAIVDAVESKNSSLKFTLVETNPERIAN